MYSERGLFIDGAWRRTGEAAEIMASAGYDSVTADLQHGAFDYQAALACSRRSARAASPSGPASRGSTRAPS